VDDVNAHPGPFGKVSHPPSEIHGA